MFPFTSDSVPSATIPLSRPAGVCGGITSLSWLAAELARAGEQAALSCLDEMGLPGSARIMWALSGNSLSISEKAGTDVVRRLEVETDAD